MVENIKVDIWFQGATFDIEKAEKLSGLALVEKEYRGRLGKTGRFKGKPMPYSSATFSAPNEIDINDRILWVAQQLEGKLDIFSQCGAEPPFHLYVGYFYSAQCNLTLTKEELKALSKLNINFWFSCYDVTEE